MSNQSALVFSSTPNPAPISGSSVQWQTSGGNGNTIAWSVSPEGIVDVRGEGSEATVVARALGMATITASQVNGSTLSRDVCVGELYAYDASGALHGAPSDAWSVVSGGSDDVLSYMRANSYGMAYDSEQNRILLDLLTLNDVRGSDLDVRSLFRASATESTRSGVAAGLATYAYAPDGTLWALGSAWSPKSGPAPAGFPSQSYMNSKGAALAWAPPDDLPPTSSEAKAAAASTETSISVTCYVLNQDQIPAHGGDITYYAFTKL